MTAHGHGLLSDDCTWLHVACCPASNIQSHMTASHMFAWLSCSCRKQSVILCELPLHACIPKHSSSGKHARPQSDEGSSGRQKKARISFEHLDMEKDLSKWNWRYTSAADGN